MDQSIKSLLAEERNLQLSDLVPAIVVGVAQDIFSDLFKFCIYANGARKETWQVDDGYDGIMYDRSKIQLYGETTMGEKFVRAELNGMFGLPVVADGNFQVGGENSLYVSYLNMHLLTGFGVNDAITSGMTALYNNIATQIWGIRMNPETRDLEFGIDAYKWGAFDFSPDAIHEQYNYYQMDAESYKVVIKQLMRGAMANTQLFIQKFIESPLFAAAMDKYFETKRAADLTLLKLTNKDEEQVEIKKRVALKMLEEYRLLRQIN